MKNNLVALIAGILFGLGLTISEMVDPARVIGFLDITGDWDPTLALVMASALLVTLPSFSFILRCHRPLCADKFSLPDKKNIDKPLIIGASLFGIGWGLGGFCPGPAITALVTLSPDVMLFVLAMLVGYYLVNFVNKYNVKK